MYLRKLVIRSFGDIDNEVLVMDRLLNCVSPTVGYAIALASLTEIEPVWFEMENSLPNCVKKA